MRPEGSNQNRYIRHGPLFIAFTLVFIACTLVFIAFRVVFMAFTCQKTLENVVI